MNKRRFAFDWGGCLENNESLRQIARDLFSAGHKVFVIPALGPWYFPYEQALAQLNVPHSGVYRVVYGPHQDPSMLEVRDYLAKEKVRVCLDLGCSVIYDDNQYNLEAARAAGIEAIEVQRDFVVARPPELIG